MSTLAELVRLLDLETLEDNLFRARNAPTDWRTHVGRVFGGQVLAQALVAAQRTVADIAAHSMHAYFLLPGDPQVPIIYETERVRDGHSFTTRRVVAIQHGRPIFVMSASFHKIEAGFEHQLPLPQGVPQPEELTPVADLPEEVLGTLHASVRAYWTRPRPVELRPVSLGHYTGTPPREPVQYVWFRARGTLPDDPALHRAVLAYTSDMTLLETALVTHGDSVLGANIQGASLDHALWLHHPSRVDEWMLYAQDSPFAGGARGLGRGLIYERSGRLVASVVQEGLIRPITPVPT